MLKLIAPFTLILCLSMPSAVRSQVWLPDRTNQEGAGLKWGEKLIVHPGAVIEGGYDTNPLRLTDPVDAGRLRLSTFLDLVNRYESRLIETDNFAQDDLPKTDFRLGLATYYDFYFSKSPSMKDYNSLGISTKLKFILFPRGKFSLRLNGTYQRTTRPYETPRDQKASDEIKPNLGLEIRPGGGTLTLALSGGTSILLFEDGSVAARNNKVTGILQFETRWDILPKTTIISTVLFTPINYLGSSEINVDSKPIRGLIGMRGLLTPRFGLALFVGYGASFYERGDDFESIIANAELMFFLSETTKLRLGAKRDFNDSFYANLYVSSGGYLGYEQTIRQIFRIVAEFDAYYREYTFLTGQYGNYTPNTDYRIDTRLGGKLLLEYRTLDWLSIMATCMYEGNVSNFAYSEDAAEGTWVDYQKIEVMLGVKAHY